MMTLFLLAVYIGVLLLLTVIPHAVLLSATGHLWPSPFSRSIVSVVAFTVLSLSAFYGTIAGYFNTIADVYHAVLYGIREGAPLLLFYVLLMQIVESLHFVCPSLLAIP